MQDGVQVAACERRSAVGNGRAAADHFDLGMAGERFAELLEPFAGSGREDPHALALGCVVTRGHRILLPGPSVSMVTEFWIVFALSSELAGGRKAR